MGGGRIGGGRMVVEEQEVEEGGGRVGGGRMGEVEEEVDEEVDVNFELNKKIEK